MAALSAKRNPRFRPLRITPHYDVSLIYEAVSSDYTNTKAYEELQNLSAELVNLCQSYLNKLTANVFMFALFSGFGFFHLQNTLLFIIFCIIFSLVHFV